MPETTRKTNRPESVAPPGADDQLVIDRTYQGFPEIALGGYVGGLLAEMLSGTVEVSLRGPVRMGRTLDVGRSEAEGAFLSDGGTPLVEARTATLEIDVPAPVSLAEAEVASASFPGFERHPFPGCFTCGPDRSHGNGLRIFPGRVAGRDLVAAAWTPDRALAGNDGIVLPRYVWAALDCPELWALMTSAPADSTERVVTAAMTVRIDAPLTAGSPHVVVAWPMHRDGRAIFAGGAIFSQHGELLVASLQRTVVVPGMGVPLGLQSLAG